jgi:hypothetical protein
MNTIISIQWKFQVSTVFVFRRFGNVKKKISRRRTSACSRVRNVITEIEKEKKKRKVFVHGGLIDPYRCRLPRLMIKRYVRVKQWHVNRTCALGTEIPTKRLSGVVAQPLTFSSENQKVHTRLSGWGGGGTCIAVEPERVASCVIIAPVCIVARGKQ